MTAHGQNAGRTPLRWIRHQLGCFLKETHGAAMVEFALVLPFLLLMFLGLIGWGYTLTLTDNMYDAARQAARELAVGGASEVEAEANAQAALATWPASFSVVAQDSSTTGTTDVQVTITAENVMANSLSFLPLASSLNASVVMRVE